MINKVHFGKRISSYRRNLELSQTQLAEKLGVTPQAVSKWECGTALPDIDLLLTLSHLYQVSINDMLEEPNLVSKLANRPFDMDGIAYFVSKTEREHNVAWAQQIVNDSWIARNWESQMSSISQARHNIAQRIVSHGGVILEIGTGPGGGYMPCILKHNPEAVVIISDLSPTVVNEWKRFLDKEMDPPNVSYAAFDFCEIPFSDCSIDVVSDGGGIGNAEGDKGNALKEAWRVLKPGGLLVTSTGFVTKETFASLPAYAQRVLQEKRPDIFIDLYEETVLAGFRKIDSIISGYWYTADDDSSIANLARELGVNLKFTSYVRFCEK